MKLSTRFALVILSGFVGLGVALLFSLAQLQHLQVVNTRMADVYLPAIGQVDDMVSAVKEVKSTVLEMFSVESDDQLEALNYNLAETKLEIRALLRSYPAIEANGERAPLLPPELTVELARTLDQVDHVAGTLRQHRLDHAQRLLRLMEKEYDLLLATLTAHDEHLDKLVEDERGAAEQAYRDRMRWTLMVTAGVLSAMVCLAWWAYLSIAQPLRYLEREMKEIGRTLDLRHRVRLAPTGEIQSTMSALNTMLDRLHSNMETIENERDHYTFRANHDELTGLPVWRLGQDRLKMSLESALRHQHKVALMFVDLDGFKQVNDTHGHPAGDMLLQEMARRLKGVVRGEDTVARVGGDEFIVILGGLERVEDVDRVAIKVLEHMSAPVAYAGELLRVGASIGIAVWPDHAADDRELVQAADQAMYEVKRKGKHAYCFAGGEVTTPPAEA